MPDHDKPAPTPPPPPPLVLDVVKLFQGRHEIYLEYHHERYRLRITKKGRLVLGK